MSTCSNKIVTFFMNLASKKFSESCNQPLKDILEIWNEVCELIPPLKDLRNRCSMIPNNGDSCTNTATNIIMPMVCNLARMYVSPACECASNIAKKCEEITKQDFTNDTSMEFDMDASLGSVGNATTAVA